LDDVKWIKFKVGTFDGMSFKKIKRAKIDGVMNFRDKLTAVWFELLDLGGKVNNNGFLINDELAFVTYEDIAIALDRTEDEIKMCLNWFIENNMMEIIDNIYLISNWSKYQNVEGLEKIREQNRLRQQKRRNKLKELPEVIEESNVLSRDTSRSPLKDNNISLSNSELSNISIKEEKKRFIKPTLEEVKEYIKDKGKNVDAELFWNFYESKNWYVGKNKMTNWHSAIATWNKPSQSNHQKPKNLTKAQFEELEQITKNKTSKMFGGLK
jgi:predicted phage replisome organizer